MCVCVCTRACISQNAFCPSLFFVFFFFIMKGDTVEGGEWKAGALVFEPLSFMCKW